MTYQGGHGNAGSYLAFLGASGTTVGVVAGAGELINFSLRLFFGFWADKTRAYWRIAFPGYLLNLVAVPCLALTHHWASAAALLIIERAGKGMRTPARDVMLSHAADKVGRGWAFGVHEALDQTGALLGPILVGVMLLYNQGYQASFGILTIPAVIALVLLIFTRREFPHTEDVQGKPVDLNPRSLPSAFWILILCIGFLALGYTDFALLAFHFKQKALIPVGWIPIAYGLAMGLQGLASILFGRLYDRWGAKALLVASIPAISFAPLAFFGGVVSAAVGVALWTIGMGAQATVMKALVAQIVPSVHRGSAYGILNSSYGVLWFLGSAAMGWLYDRSVTGLVLFSVLAQTASLPFLVLLSRQKLQK